MRTRHIKLAFVVALAVIADSCLATSARATIVQVAGYRLGEPGSVGASAPFVPLVDSIGGDNNINSYNTPAGGTTAVVTTGLVAPGSTHALQISNNAAGGGTWYSSSFSFGAGLTDNWAIDLWIRPDFSGGTYVGATDGNGGTQDGLVFWAASNAVSGTSLGGKTVSAGSNHLLLFTGANAGDGFIGANSSTYTVGQWTRLSIITRNGTVNYYLDQVLQDSATPNGHFLNDIRLGAGFWATTGTNAAFDEMAVWTFAPTDPLREIQNAVFGIPEPSSIALLGLGGLGLVAHVWRRRRC
jgi:hypothetical protein